MGHVINYAYRLYEHEDWIKLFGSITQPYLEEYHPVPFSQRYVWHLPGWYAQKHPDEDWAETFAVWMTPGRDWRAEYAPWPTALAKLEYTDRTIKSLYQQQPATVTYETDEDVRDLPYSLEQFYERINSDGDTLPHGLAGSLRAIFEELNQDSKPTDGKGAPVRRPASALLRRMERELMDSIFRWTGHFPERTRVLVR